MEMVFLQAFIVANDWNMANRCAILCYTQVFDKVERSTEQISSECMCSITTDC